MPIGSRLAHVSGKRGVFSPRQLTTVLKQGREFCGARKSPMWLPRTRNTGEVAAVFVSFLTGWRVSIRLFNDRCSAPAVTCFAPVTKVYDDAATQVSAATKPAGSRLCGVCSGLRQFARRYG